MKPDELRPNKILRGPLFPEPVQVIVTMPMGAGVKLIGKGLQTSKVFEVVLTPEKLALLETTPDTEPFDGDSKMFRLGIEAMRLALAFEYDPYFSLSIARVDPLPHQLEAVYDYFLRLPRIRFLLADDPGAGKTIMAGLLIKELKIRGLVKRILIIAPASLSFQWQREMKDKFRENFEIIRSDILRANYGSNPWQDKNQIVTSVSWVSRIEDAKESLLRSHWDLIIVDEAHKMSAASRDKKTLAYQLGEELSRMTDHFLLMTATPHKGDPDHFCLFLELLDRDVYGDVKSLEEAMKKHDAPFYLRRVKDALVTFPDPDTGKVKKLFTERVVQTTEFQLTETGEDCEADFYDALTRFVEDQSIKAASENSARGRALGFTMAMLQRRFASSIYAVRRSLERMKEKREKILADPEAYRQEQINRRLPEDFEDLTDQERQAILDELEELVFSYDPAALRDEIVDLTKLIDQARRLEDAEVESKLVKLRELLQDRGVFTDPKMKLLLFTEHKDTLDYLAGDGKDGRPLGRLVKWGLSLTQIHGGMKIGDRDTPGTRIYAEREFRESAQVLVATEAAGEGINLQFCWFMINYDVPWNFVRLEQRMGRIHRYGQEKDCLILNFVSTNTREGRVMQKIFERVKAAEDDLDPQRTGKVFNVLGDVFPANLVEKMIRDMYARNQTEEVIKQRIVEGVDTARFQRITDSTLEGLAKRELNLSAIIGKSAEAKERRLVPEVIEDFFVQAAPTSGIQLRHVASEGLPRPLRGGEGWGEGASSSLPSSHTYRIGRVPRQLWPIGERLEPRFGKLGHEYKNVVFDKQLLPKDPTLEWVTPGHPLFEAVREDLLENAASDLQRGSIFYDLHASAPYRLDFFAASVKDGRDNQIHRRLFAVQTEQTGQMSVKQSTVLLDLAVPPPGSGAGILPALEGGSGFQPEGGQRTQEEAGKMPAPHFKPLNKAAEIHKHRRRLPHWQQDGCTYSVTFRLADSVPQEELQVWQEQKEIWLKHHPQPWSEKTAGEYEERFVEGLQKWLDAGYGTCALQAEAVRTVVENALLHFDGQRYALDEFVIMPNHVHLLVQPMASVSLSSILHSWKSFSSNVVNKQLGRSGTFWLDENFDHAVRSLSQFNYFRRYIAENPTRAHLRPGSFALGRGAGILPALEDSATWRPPAQTGASTQDACPTGSRQDACSTPPDLHAIEAFLVEHALNPLLAEVTTQRARETQTITRHLEISLNELINRQQVRLGELSEMQERGLPAGRQATTSQPLAANIKQTEDRIDELNARLEHRRAELERERECMIGDIQHVARAWVLPHPERKTPDIAAMVADPEIERIAVQFATKHEEAQGRVVESVEKDNRGFDLISRMPHPEDPKTAIDVRFIEVKGRASTGEIALTSNEYQTAKRLRKDYYLYVVFHCAVTPSLNPIQDPASLDWQPIVKIEQYRLNQNSVSRPIQLKEDPPPYRTTP